MMFLKNISFSLTCKRYQFLSLLHTRHRCLSNKVSLAYEIHNNTGASKATAGLPVIILHGLFGSKTNWRSVSKVIQHQTGRKIITVDARNHGDSPHVDDVSYELMKNDLKAFLNDLGLKKVVLVGHSMGGRTAMYLALTEPSYVAELVVVDVSPFCISIRHNLVQFAEALHAIDFPKGIPISQVRRQANKSLELIVQDEAARQFLVSNIIEGTDKTCRWRFNVDSIAKNISKIINFPVFPVTTNFAGPTLFIGGGDSDFIPLQDINRIKWNLFPEAEFHFIPGAGHFVHSEKPTEFAEVLINFLNSAKA